MAAPPDMTTLNLSGRFIMNKTLSDDPDEILRLQGVGWLMRRLISLSTITLYIDHYKDDTGVEHVDIQQIGTGGFKGGPENRTLTWENRAIEDPLYGPVVGRSRRIKVEDVQDAWLSTGWSPDTHTHGLIEAYAESDTPKSGRTWIADLTWGFADINGQRQHIRHIHFTGPDGEDIKNKLVYDYAGPETHP